MKYPCLLLLALFYSTFTFAQSNYKPGYIVKLNGDTVKGDVDYKGWDKNPGSVNFKDDANEAVKTYTTADINAFGVTGLEFYEKRTVPISDDEIEVSKLSTSSQVHYNTGTVFLRILTKGKFITLYSYVDELKKRYYVADNSSNETNELIYHLYVNGEILVVHTIDRFHSQLENLAQKFNKNTGQLENLIVHARYNDDDLLPIAVAINGSADKEITPVGLFGTRFFAGAAVTDNTVSFSGTLIFSNNSSLFPKLAAGIDFIPNKVKQQLFFRLELAVTGEKHNLYSTAHTPNYNGTSVSHTLNYSQFTVIATPQIFYNFYNTDLLKVFLAGGLNLNYASYNNYKTLSNFSNISSLEQDKYPNMLSLYISFPFKAGILLNKKIELYGTYTLPATVTQYTDISSSVRTYEAGINYLFGGK